MKKILLLSTLSLFLAFNSCKKEKAATPVKKEVTTQYTIDIENSSVQWTAYKTTDKVPVKGTFTEIIIDSSVSGSSPSDLLNGMEFKIPVISIFSKDSIRDGKLNKFFFDVMEKTVQLKGTFSLEENGKGSISLTMNGLTNDLPVAYTITDDIVDIQGTMDLDNWGAQAALASLNEACNALHTGADGIAKTWNEVAISAQIKTIVKQ